MRIFERQPHRDDGSGRATEGKAQVHPGMPDRWREGRRKRARRKARPERFSRGGQGEMEGVAEIVRGRRGGRRRRAEGRMNEREAQKERERAGGLGVEGKLK